MIVSFVRRAVREEDAAARLLETSSFGLSAGNRKGVIVADTQLAF